MRVVNVSVRQPFGLRGAIDDIICSDSTVLVIVDDGDVPAEQNWNRSLTDAGAKAFMIKSVGEALGLKTKFRVVVCDATLDAAEKRAVTDLVDDGSGLGVLYQLL